MHRRGRTGQHLCNGFRGLARFLFSTRGGKFRRTIGSLKGGEGFFKRPTGIAVDSAADRIYVTDTLRNKVFMLDMKGSVLQTIGRRGTEHGEFNLPTEVLVHAQNLFVVDAMNFRVQFLDRSGAFQTSVGQIGDYSGTMFRPKGIGLDSEEHLYVVDGLWGVVQVFDRQGRLLYYFGSRGTHLGEFQLPAGLFVDHDDRIFVVDSYQPPRASFPILRPTKASHGRPAMKRLWLLSLLMFGVMIQAQTTWWRCSGRSQSFRQRHRSCERAVRCVSVLSRSTLRSGNSECSSLEPDTLGANLCGLFEHNVAQCSATAHIRWIKQPVLELS